VIVFSFTAAFAVGKAEQTTALIPALVIVIVVGAIGVFLEACRAALSGRSSSLRLWQSSHDGRQVVDGVYPDETLEPPAAAARRDAVEGEVLWPGPAATLQAIDVPALLRFAERMDVVIELRVLLLRDLAIETVKGSEGEPRVLLRLPSWEDYVSVSLDAIIANVGSSPLVRRRIEGLLTGLIAIAPAGRQEALRARRETTGEAGA